MTRNEIAALAMALVDSSRSSAASTADKANLYTQLGLTLICRPRKQLLEAMVTPGIHMCTGFVSEAGVEPIAHAPVLSDEVVVGRQHRLATR